MLTKLYDISCTNNFSVCNGLFKILWLSRKPPTRGSPVVLCDLLTNTGFHYRTRKVELTWIHQVRFYKVTPDCHCWMKKQQKLQNCCYVVLQTRKKVKGRTSAAALRSRWPLKKLKKYFWNRKAQQRGFMIETINLKIPFFNGLICQNAMLGGLWPVSK